MGRSVPSPLLRTLSLIAGAALIVLSPVVGILPGPGGIFVFAAGLMLVLRHSRRARRHWVQLKRRWPRLGTMADRVMRRPSERRRRARAAALLD